MKAVVVYSEMQSIIPLFVIILFFLISNVSQAKETSPKIGPERDYCDVECNDHKHTVCKRKNQCGPVSGCKNIPITQDFRKLMLDCHNEFREEVASGRAGHHYENKGAGDMNVLNYDLELEYIAACWVYTCPGLINDHCRSYRFGPAGQNIFWARNVRDDARLACQSWFKEIKHVKRKTIEKFKPNSKTPISQFTQMMWSKTQHIGCAHAKYGDGEVLVVCNYGLAGNWINEEVYSLAFNESYIARNCTSTGNYYKSLCGNAQPIPKDGCLAGTNMIRISDLLVFLVISGWNSLMIF